MWSNYQTNADFFLAVLFSTLLHGAIVLLVSFGSKKQEVYSTGNQQVMHAVMIDQTALQAVSSVHNGKQLAIVNTLTQRSLTEHELSKRSNTKAVASALSKKQPTQIAQQPITEERAEKKSIVVGTRKIKNLKAESQTVPAAVQTRSLSKAVEKGEGIQKKLMNEPISKDNKYLKSSTHGSNQTCLKNRSDPTAKEISDYYAHVQAAIERNLILDSYYQGKSCEVALRIAEDGSILRIEPRHGDSVVCAALVRAAAITERVPKPPNEKLYQVFKDVTIVFYP